MINLFRRQSKRGFNELMSPQMKEVNSARLSAKPKDISIPSSPLSPTSPGSARIRRVSLVRRNSTVSKNCNNDLKNTEAGLRRGSFQSRTANSARNVLGSMQIKLKSTD